MRHFIVFLFIYGCVMAVLSVVIITSTSENTVLRIIDGNTVIIKGATAQSTIKVRLQGIDAPENGQPYAKNSKKVLSKLVHKKIVRLEGNEHDKYGRLHVRLYVDDLDVSKMMISQGAAWVYYINTRDDALYKAEDLAKQYKHGLWRLINPVPPWEWRQK